MIKPPRTLFVPFPFGAPLGKAREPDIQRRVLLATLELLNEPSGPTLKDLPGRRNDRRPATPPQASDLQEVFGPVDAATEVSMMRRYHEEWVRRAGRTSVGLSGIPPRRFRGLVRFIEKLSRGESADMPERPPDVSLPDFIRRCVDDLKAMYYEARLQTVPQEDAAGLARWFWGETAVGRLLRSLKDALGRSDDADLRAVSRGIAR